MKILLAVNGTLMRDLTLNKNLVSAGAEFIRDTKTAVCYSLWSINDEYPAMLRSSKGGNSIDVEVWKIATDGLLDVLSKEPPGLCLGKIELIDNTHILGILAETWLCEGQKEITAWRGWRNYIADPNFPGVPGLHSVDDHSAQKTEN